MIEPILNEIEPLIVNELYRANLTNPPFHSSHEGVAIIEEEVEESKESLEIVFHCFHSLKNNVFNDRYPEADKEAVLMRKHVKYAIAELVQVAAMCDKFYGIRGDTDGDKQ